MNSQQTMNQQQLNIEKRQLEIDRRQLEIDRRQVELEKEAFEVAKKKEEEENQFLIEYEEKKTLLLDEMKRKKTDAVAVENYELAISIRDEIDFIEKDGMKTSNIPETLRTFEVAHQLLRRTDLKCSSVDLRPGAGLRRQRPKKIIKKVRAETEDLVSLREIIQDADGVWFYRDSVNGTCNNKLSRWYNNTGEEIANKWNHSDKKHPFVHWCRTHSKGVSVDVAQLDAL